MCIYFIKLHEALTELENQMIKQFSKFKQQISDMPNHNQKKYNKYLNIMDTIGSHYGEGDWIDHTYEGEEFGSHYLGYHTTPINNTNCIYCQDKIQHVNSQCDQYCTYCTYCKDE